MVMIDPEPAFNAGRDVLFLGCGTGASAVFYYRCLLPAQQLGASYASVYGGPPKTRWATGLVHQAQGPPTSTMPVLDDYRIVVMQQPSTRGWLDVIHALRERGVKVVFEIDDYIHGIPNHADHDFREKFDKARLAGAEACMRAADAIICSTPFIAEQYRHFRRRTFVCENGIDLARYDIQRPERGTVNIGWAGATGHREALRAWLPAVGQVMERHPETCFVALGQPWGAHYLGPMFGPRVIAIPFAAIEQYPGAMSMMDIALAPARDTGFYRGKSDLRWLEAGALGIPIIADPLVYPKIDPNVNGLWASSVTEAHDALEMLTVDGEMRREVGANARAHVREHRSIEVASRAWLDAFTELDDRY